METAGSPLFPAELQVIEVRVAGAKRDPNQVASRLQVQVEGALESVPVVPLSPGHGIGVVVKPLR
jgi:hypothetical protein